MSFLISQLQLAEPFSFGFSNDDIEDDEDVEEQMDVDTSSVHHLEGKHVQLAPPRLHSLEELLSHLPSTISYSSHQFPHPTNGNTVTLPRRELFDIRAQLMAEEDDPTDTDTNNPIPPGLSSLNDITPTIYEGGFKTWECATDLAKYLLTLLETGSLNLYNRPVHIIELGAGTSLPTLTLLSHLLSQPLPSTPPKTPIHLTLADYNPTVLTHASLPNALLTYLSTLNRSTYPPSSDQPLSPALLTSFTAALRARAITLDFISGAWGEEFVQLVRGAAQARAGAARGSSRDNSSNNYSPAAAAAPPPPPPAPLTLVLASETIYAPASLEAFTSTVVELLSPSPRSLHLPPSHSSTTTAHSSLALVAAKRIYFGVGGGVDAFMRSLEGRGGGGGAQGREVWGSESLRGGGGGGGVGRCVLEVRGGEE